MGPKFILNLSSQTSPCWMLFNSPHRSFFPYRTFNRVMPVFVKQFPGLVRAPLTSSLLSRSNSYTRMVPVWRPTGTSSAITGEILCAARIKSPVAITPEDKEREALKKLFHEAAERARTTPMEGVTFTLEEFQAALESYNFDYDIGSKIEGTVFMNDANGTIVTVPAKSMACLPLQEACIHKIKHAAEAGIVPGLIEEFTIVGKNVRNESLILSLRSNQYDLAWERCMQLHGEDAVVTGKVVAGNRGGVVVMVECLRGFVPFSQMSTKSTAEELLDKELPLKFLVLDEENSKIILSNRKAIADSQAKLEIGSVVLGTVQSLKPYGAFVDVGGINGLLHVSQISHDRISDISTLFQPGDTLKVMILSYDQERGRLSLSTKKLEPTPGDMIHNPMLVFEKADEIAQTFRKRIAQAEALARADMMRFQPESGLHFNPDNILRPFSPNSAADDDGVSLSEDKSD